MSGNCAGFELRLLFEPYFIYSPYSRLVVVVKSQHIVPRDGDGQHEIGRETDSKKSQNHGIRQVGRDL